MEPGWIGRAAVVAWCAVAVSCAGRSGQPEHGQAAPVAEAVAEPVPAPAVDEPPPETVGRAKLWSGSVRFVGFSERDLDGFRVIPEQRSRVYRPRNSEYQGVDGFWWKGERTRWFKIPGHCTVVVSPANAAGAPRADAPDEEVISGGGRPQTWTKCKPWLTRILVSQGRVSKAGWYPNAGTSTISAGYPW